MHLVLKAQIMKVNNRQFLSYSLGIALVTIQLNSFVSDPGINPIIEARETLVKFPSNFILETKSEDL